MNVAGNENEETLALKMAHAADFLDLSGDVSHTRVLHAAADGCSQSHEVEAVGESPWLVSSKEQTRRQ